MTRHGRIAPDAIRMEDGAGRRLPGRPPGSSKYSRTDPALLRQVADRLRSDPSLTTRAAIVRSVGCNDPAALRRLQVKFREHAAQENVLLEIANGGDHA